MRNIEIIKKKIWGDVIPPYKLIRLTTVALFIVAGQAEFALRV